METDQSFLKRWSQRKTAVEAETTKQPLVDEELSIPPVDSSNLSQESKDNQTESEITNDNQQVPVIELTDEDMPDIDTLDENSNFNQFFSEGVSEALRNKALRKLFSLPEFNERDGLNDYDQDFSNITPLAEAAATQVRQWIHQQKEDFEAALNDDEALEDEPEESDQLIQGDNSDRTN